MCSCIWISHACSLLISRENNPSCQHFASIIASTLLFCSVFQALSTQLRASSRRTEQVCLFITGSGSGPWMPAETADIIGRKWICERLWPRQTRWLMTWRRNRDSPRLTCGDVSMFMVTVQVYFSHKFRKFRTERGSEFMTRDVVGVQLCFNTLWTRMDGHSAFLSPFLASRASQ